MQEGRNRKGRNELLARVCRGDLGWAEDAESVVVLKAHGKVPAAAAVRAAPGAQVGEFVVAALQSGLGAGAPI